MCYTSRGVTAGMLCVCNHKHRKESMLAFALIDLRGNRDQQNTSHAGLPPRHGIQNESGHDRGQTRTPSSGASQGPLRARTGVPVVAMHMSGGQTNLAGMGIAAGQGGPHVVAVEMGENAPDDASERETKRQRSSDWAVGVGHIQSEEGDWASACFAEGDVPSVLEHELGWQ